MINSNVHILNITIIKGNDVMHSSVKISTVLVLLFTASFNAFAAPPDSVVILATQPIPLIAF